MDELRALIRKTFGLQEVPADALHPLENKVHIAFVYSSFATGTETGDSDVDVMTVGDGLTLDEVVAGLSPIQAEISREINPSLYRAAECRRRVATGHHFLSAVMREPKIYLVGSEDELERLTPVRVAKESPSQSSRNRPSACGH